MNVAEVTFEYLDPTRHCLLQPEVTDANVFHVYVIIDWLKAYTLMSLIVGVLNNRGGG